MIKVILLQSNSLCSLNQQEEVESVDEKKRYNAKRMG